MKAVSQAVDQWIQKNVFYYIWLHLKTLRFLLFIYFFLKKKDITYYSTLTL